MCLSMYKYPCMHACTYVQLAPCLFSHQQYMAICNWLLNSVIIKIIMKPKESLYIFIHSNKIVTQQSYKNLQSQ